MAAENNNFDYPGNNLKWGQTAGGDLAGKYPNPTLSFGITGSTGTGLIVRQTSPTIIAPTITGGSTATGFLGGYYFQDRHDATKTWAWYADADNARLWNFSLGDLWFINYTTGTTGLGVAASASYTLNSNSNINIATSGGNYSVGGLPRIGGDTSYTVMYDPAVNGSIFCGNPGVDGSNYYRNTTHKFQNVAGAADLFTVTSAGSGVFYGSCSFGDGNFYIHKDLVGANCPGINFNAACYFTYLRATGDNYFVINNAVQWGFTYSTGIFYDLISNMQGNGAYVNASDSRLKKDITPSTKGLDVVLNLNTVEFERLDQTNSTETKVPRTEIGFVAQDVREHFPQAVVELAGVENPEGEAPILGIQSEMIVALLVNSVKELHAEIVALKAKYS